MNLTTYTVRIGPPYAPPGEEDDRNDAAVRRLKDVDLAGRIAKLCRSVLNGFVDTDSCPVAVACLPEWGVEGRRPSDSIAGSLAAAEAFLGEQALGRVIAEVCSPDTLAAAVRAAAVGREIGAATGKALPRT